VKTSRFLAMLFAAGFALGLPARGFAADEIHWTLTGQTSVTIDWRGSETAVRYGVTKDLGQTAKATVQPQPFSSKGPFQEARITGLKENTLYCYAIGDVPVHTFRTPPPRGRSGFTFIVQGDIGNASDWSRVGVVQTMIAEKKPDFVLCIGDLTYANPVGQPAVDAHFNDVMCWSQDAAYMPAWGNHEWDEPKYDDMRNYKGRFDLPNPQASPVDSRYKNAGGGEDWYWFDYGNVRFVAYPEPWRGAWEDWGTSVTKVMHDAEEDSTIDFIVTFGHRPAFSSGYHEGEPELQGIMGTLRKRFPKFVLNFNGHSHDYERTQPQNGVVHVTAGTGGSDLEEKEEGECVWMGGCPQPPWSAFRAMHHVVVQLRAESDRIDGTVFCGPTGGGRANRNDILCERGAVVDSFTVYPYGVPPGHSPPASEEEEEHQESRHP
jgi:calcineurin-like phosphoesterase family protein/purple acid phosphatase-like protein